MFFCHQPCHNNSKFRSLWFLGVFGRYSHSLVSTDYSQRKPFFSLYDGWARVLFIVWPFFMDGLKYIIIHIHRETLCIQWMNAMDQGMQEGALLHHCNLVERENASVCWSSTFAGISPLYISFSLESIKTHDTGRFETTIYIQWTLNVETRVMIIIFRRESILIGFPGLYIQCEEGYEPTHTHTPTTLWRITRLLCACVRPSWMNKQPICCYTLYVGGTKNPFGNEWWEGEVHHASLSIPSKQAF